MADEMLVLLTRPQEDSESLATLLKARGIASLIEPMLTIRPCADVRLSTRDVQALLLTSANGARFLAKAISERDLPVYVVGNATAETARSLGFKKVHSAAGDARALADLVADRVDPTAGSLLHVAGKTLAGDLATALAARGYDVRRKTLYETTPAMGISPVATKAFQEGKISAVLFFSPRTAGAFVRLACEAGLAPYCKRVVALCLSPAVAKAADTIRWQALQVSTHPDVNSLLHDLDDVVNRVGKGKLDETGQSR
ncbi:MAG: uroporphyrinogen-III synthase [Alphaproteobacteria bacterium]|nr:uroporphyrinogen-III synthase [Alphaproteobacteria bacterium]